ncbi:Uncharacterized protein HZ326_20626 [Fusarium oxysporum f. sp. albedinis]|nr:Uncharacterized protein HZ326_20626 [Fusarium oxysporum f. sp. albedinis]
MQDEEEGSILLDYPSAASSCRTTNASLGSSQLTIQKSDNESGCKECKERSFHPGIIRSRLLAQFLFLESMQASLDTLANFPSSQEKFLDQMNQPNAFPCQSLRNGNFLAMAELENGSEEMKSRAQPQALPIRGPKRLDSATSAQCGEGDEAV